MPGHAEALAVVEGLLPPVPGPVVGVLHVVALLGVVYVFSLGGLQFSSSGLQVFGRRLTTRAVLVALLVGAVLVATARWWAPVVFVLTGWQAFGLICLEVGWLLQSTARGVDPAALVMAAVGLLLVVLPWVA